jgi:hypothetical protein
LTGTIPTVFGTLVSVVSILSAIGHSAAHTMA